MAGDNRRSLNSLNVCRPWIRASRRSIIRRPHQLVIGCRGGEAVAGVRFPASDLRSDLGEPVQQDRLVPLFIARQRRGDLRQLVFAFPEERRELLGHGQREQGQDAVGVDLKQPLDHAPCLPRRHAAVPDQKPAEAVAMNAEIGQRGRCTAGNRRPDQRVACEQSRTDVVIILLLIGIADQVDMGRDDQLARKVGQPLLRHVQDRRLGEGLRRLTRRNEGEPVELRMALPLDAERPDIEPVMVGAWFRGGDLEMLQKIAELLPVRIPRPLVGKHRQIGQPLGRHQRLGRTCMHLVIELEPVRMVRGQGLVGRTAFHADTLSQSSAAEGQERLTERSSTKRYNGFAHAPNRPMP